MKQAMIISAYPGVGKSYAVERLSKELPDMKFLDSDSSFFSWIYDNKGNKTNRRNPRFPENYIDYIKSHIQDADIIFVSSHFEVRECLTDENIDYIVAVPSLSVESLRVLRSGMEKRGSSFEFVTEQMGLLKKRVHDIMYKDNPNNHMIVNMDKEHLYECVRREFMHRK